LISLGPGEPLDSPVDTLRGYVPDAGLFKDHAGAIEASPEVPK